MMLNPYRFGGGAPPTAQVLMHFNGSNGSTTMTDESGKTWTAGGNAQLSTAQSIEGGSSLWVDGSGDWINTGNNVDFQVGTGDFTMECWVRRVGTGGTFFAYYRGGGVSSGGVSFNLDASNRLEAGRAGVGVVVTAATPLSTGAWHHVALCRSGGGTNNTKLFLNGTIDGQATFASSWSDVGSIALASIGAYMSGAGTSAGNFNGYIDEFRYIKGTALYTANFTPPTPPLS